jgi:TP901 family phage tail tape measure protein
VARTERLILKNKAVDRVSRVLDRIKSRFPKMSSAIRKVNSDLTKLNARFGTMFGRMRKFGAAAKNMGRGMTTGLSLPIAVAGGAILRTAFKFQKSINKVGAITRTIIGGKVTPEFKALEAEAKRLGATTEFSANQTADAMVNLGRAGLSTAEILESVDDVLALASAGGVDLAFSADVMAKTMRQFNLQASEATRITDVLADVSRRSNVDLESIAETFKDAAPIAKQYGATLEQTAALTGLLGDIGIQGSKAGTTLKNVFLKLATATPKMNDTLASLGISLTKTDGGMNDVGEVLTKLGPALARFPKKAQLTLLNK